MAKESKSLLKVDLPESVKSDIFSNGVEDSGDRDIFVKAKTNDNLVAHLFLKKFFSIGGYNLSLSKVDEKKRASLVKKSGLMKYSFFKGFVNATRDMKIAIKFSAFVFSVVIPIVLAMDYHASWGAMSFSFLFLIPLLVTFFTLINKGASVCAKFVDERYAMLENICSEENIDTKSLAVFSLLRGFDVDPLSSEKHQRTNIKNALVWMSALANRYLSDVSGDVEKLSLVEGKANRVLELVNIIDSDLTKTDTSSSDSFLLSENIVSSFGEIFENILGLFQVTKSGGVDTYSDMLKSVEMETGEKKRFDEDVIKNDMSNDGFIELSNDKLLELLSKDK